MGLVRTSKAFVERLESRVLMARDDSLISAGWRFSKGDVLGASGVTFNDSAWSSVNLPHTWNNLDGQDGGNNYYRGPSWYRKRLSLTTTQASKRLFLKFEGASLVADVYVNGAFVGQHRGGFAAFTYDVTGKLKAGENVIAVKVNNAKAGDIAPRSGDFTVFGGIYRDVRLIATDPVHVDLLDHASPGVYLKQTNVSSASANLNVTTRVRNDASTSRSVTLISRVYDQGNVLVKTLTSTATIAANSTSNVQQSTSFANPRLWDGRANPYLYRVRVSVSDTAGSLDELDQPLGFRSFSVSPSGGFFLNGRSYDLHGANLHQDRLNKGWAISSADRNQDFDILKEIGATAARLAHYQHAQHAYDRLDRDGIVAWAEIPLVNEIIEHTAFTDNARQQLRELIRQNYNHPSIVFWGIFNELNDGLATNALVQDLTAIAKAEDPTRLSTAATDEPDAAPLNWNTQVTAFNKYFGWYYGNASDIAGWADKIHAAYPTKSIGLSEYGAGGSINQHAVPPSRPAAGGLFHPEEYQSQFHEAYWKALKTRPFIWSKLVWNLFDFASDGRNEGDAPGRNDKGLVTFDRTTRKDAFYYYKANWSSSPVLHITSRRFTQRTVAATEVKVYSNLSNVTLKLNGKVLGTTSGVDGVFRWNVTLAAGANLVEVTGTRNGVVYTDTCTWTLATSTGPPTPYNGTPFSIGTSASTTIQAEQFDNGGEGVAYHDLESANLGNTYRATGVDIQGTSDTGGGYNVGWTKAGEWLVYSVNVAEAGAYNVDFRVASGSSGGTFHLELGTTNITGTMSMPNTGGWQTWRTITKSVNLAAGTHLLHLKMDGNGSAGYVGNINYIRITRSGASQPTPYTGTPIAIPSTGSATVQAENFDNGGEGVAYHDLESANLGGAYRATGVDIQGTADTGGGYNVGWTRAGEWLVYSVNVAQAGAYNVDFRVASGNSGGTFHLELGTTNITGTMSMPNTGGWQTWRTITKSVNLVAGTHLLRLKMDANGSSGYVGNFNYLKLSAAAAALSATSTAGPITAVSTTTAAHVRDGSYADVDDESSYIARIEEIEDELQPRELFEV